MTNSLDNNKQPRSATIHAVILAGGSGTRLWPLSRQSLPKQFVSLFSDKTLLEETVARLAPIIDRANVTIVTSAAAAKGEPMMHLAPYQMLLEPCARNTAPAIAIAALKLMQSGDDPVMVVLPSDHMIADVPTFQSRLQLAIAEALDGHLVTFGIEPTHPETGYGYIQTNGACSSGSSSLSVAQFKEKPDLETAKTFLKAGGYYWNSGMFVWRASRILAAIEMHLPALAATIANMRAELAKGVAMAEAIDRHFASAPSISIDHGVLEKLSRDPGSSPGRQTGDVIEAPSIVVPAPEPGPHSTAVIPGADPGPLTTPLSSTVIPAPEPGPHSTTVIPGADPGSLTPPQLRLIPANIGWSDVGSWDSVQDLSAKDADGNSLRGNVITHASHNIQVQGGKRLIAAVGVDDLSIIDTPDALLVTKRGQAQGVKHIVEALQKRNSSTEHIEHTTVQRPWGSYTVLEELPGCKIKRIEVKPGGRLSLQSHQHRSEHWVVVSGVATVTCGERVTDLEANESTYIPVGTKHRLENRGSAPVNIIEVQVGAYLGEDDIQRFDDQYGRVSTPPTKETTTK